MRYKHSIEPMAGEIFTDDLPSKIY